MARFNFDATANQLDEQLLTQKVSQKKRTLYGALFIAVLIGVVAFVVLSPSKTPLQKGTPELRAKSKKKFSTSSDDVNYTLKRVGYDALKYFSSDYTSHLKYAFLADYQAVIEPYQSMELNLYGSTGLTDDSVSYEAIVCPTDESEDCQTAQMYYDTTTETTVTSSVYFSCSGYDTYTITLYTYDSDGDVTNQVTDSAICLYVRREIRDYTSSDLNKFLDALYTMTVTEDEEGQSTYGSSYLSTKTIARLHFWNAGQRDADHIHEGNGFLTQHIKLNTVFEASLQEVDPSLTMPYWDFTIDNSSGVKIFGSFVSSADVFGSVSYPKSSIKGFTRTSDRIEDARIADGRWADQLVEMNTMFPTLYAAYGYLRAPWVLNPSPYTSRYSFDWDVEFGYLPSCYYNYDILEYTDLMDYFYEISFGPHGTAHTTYGGVYGCDALADWVTDGIVSGEEDLQEVCSYMGNTIKELFRYGYTDSPKNCTLNTTNYANAACYYECRPEYTYAGAAAFYDLFVDYLADGVDRDDFYSYFAEFMCSESFSKLFVGDHYESSSMTDPSFWVMHPTIERLTQAKLMSGGFESETWDTDPLTEFVCSKTSCYDEDLDETDYFEDCCYGHYEYDQMYNGFMASRDDYYGQTNHDAWAATDPRYDTYTETYIYDDFSYSHCADSGYDVDELLITQYEESLTSQGKPKQPRKMPASQLKTRKKKKAQLDLNRKRVEMSIAVNSAKKAQAAKHGVVTHDSKKSKKVRKVLPGSPTQKLKS